MEVQIITQGPCLERSKSNKIEDLNTTKVKLKDAKDDYEVETTMTSSYDLSFPFTKELSLKEKEIVIHKNEEV